MYDATAGSARGAQLQRSQARRPPLFNGLATSPPLPDTGQLLSSNPRLFEDLDLNALTRLELVGDLETDCEVQILDEEIAGLAPVRDVEGCLCRRFAQAA